MDFYTEFEQALFDAPEGSVVEIVLKQPTPATARVFVSFEGHNWIEVPVGLSALFLAAARFGWENKHEPIEFTIKAGFKTQFQWLVNEIEKYSAKFRILTELEVDGELCLGTVVTQTGEISFLAEISKKKRTIMKFECEEPSLQDFVQKNIRRLVAKQS